MLLNYVKNKLFDRKFSHWPSYVRDKWRDSGIKSSQALDELMRITDSGTSENIDKLKERGHNSFHLSSAISYFDELRPIKLLAYLSGDDGLVLGYDYKSEAICLYGEGRVNRDELEDAVQKRISRLNENKCKKRIIDELLDNKKGLDDSIERSMSEDNILYRFVR